MTARLSVIAALTLSAAAPPALAQGDAAPPPLERPGFNLSNRHTEDWSNFDAAAEDTGWLYDTLDGFKHIGNGGILIKIRIKFEYDNTA